MSSAIQLRSTIELDLDFVVQAESAPENAAFIVPWSYQQHIAALSNQDIAYFIVQELSEQRPVGFLIVCGVASPNRSLEFRRIVITEKGKGLGRAVLELLKEKAFIELGMHRLWLDVKEHNQRARHLYKSVGFTEEGLLREALWNGETYESLVIMSILEREFSPKKASPK